MFKGRLATLGRTLGAVGAVTVLLSVWGVVATMTPPQEGASRVTHGDGGNDGWGGEALVANTVGLSPIAAANACGLGASSCFKCHNGQRAEAPSAKPWHTEHAKVNHSCAGCHGGNPRLLKESIAHRGMMANPVESPEKACADCHKDGNVDTLAETYRQQQGG